MNRLKDKVAVVTGASKGLGAAIAKHFAAEGAAVVVNYSSSKSAADAVVADIAAKGGRAIAVQGNVSRQADIERLFAEAKAAFGKVDILINNAGVYEFLPLEQVTAEHIHRLFDLNVAGLVLTTQEAVRSFGAEGGAIVNVSSIVSLTPQPGGSVYAGTKGAVDAITKSLAKELAAKNIRVNTVHPGLIPTEGAVALEGMGPSFDRVRSVTPLGRLGTPEDIAQATVFLASDESSFITGEGIVLAGGFR